MARDVPQSDRVHVDLDPAAVVAAYAGHRRRFAEEMSSLDAAALATPSRCSEWSVADVLRHLCDVDEWMHAIWSGGSLPFETFDPRTTPHERVLVRRDRPDEQVRDDYVASSEATAADMDRSGEDRWDAAAISPLGFVPWWLSVLHIYWDSSIHERDVLMPLGREAPVVRDEMTQSLTYGLALAGTFIAEPVDLVVAGVRVTTGEGPVRVTPVDPSIEAGQLIDALAGRGDISEAVGDPVLAGQLSGPARMLRPRG